MQSGAGGVILTIVQGRPIIGTNAENKGKQT